MSNSYYAILTDIGKAKEANALAGNGNIIITHFSVGDGELLPNSSQVVLQNEKYRAEVSAISIKNETTVKIECLLPKEIGGFNIAEIGLWQNNELIVVANYPKSYKPTLKDGIAKDIIINVNMGIADAQKVEIVVDNSVVMASRAFVEDEISALKAKIEENITATTGQVAFFAMTTAPVGWLKANGATISRITYAKLFAQIGTTFGGGNGSTTFQLPDLRGEFLRGWDDSRGNDMGRVLGSWQEDSIKNHSHTFTTGSASDMNGGRFPLSVDDYYGGQAFTNTTSATGGLETRPRNIALLACIKY